MIKIALFAVATCLSFAESTFASPGDIYRIQAAELEARAQLQNPESIEYLESTIFGDHGNANRFVCGYVHRKDGHAGSRYIWSNLAPHKIIDEQVYPLPMVFNAQWNTICRDDSPNSEPLAAVQTTDPKQSWSVPQPALPVANPNIAYKVAQVPPPRGSVPAESENWQPIGPDTPIDEFLARQTKVAGSDAPSTSIMVGGTPVTIPNPVGFELLVPQMKVAYELQKQSVPTGAEQFGAYIADSEVQKALDDAGDLDISRRFVVSTAKSILDASLTPSDFSLVKEVIRTQNEENVRKAEKAMPGLVDNVNRYVKQKTGIERAVSVIGVMDLPPHDDTDHSISYSLFEKINVKDRTGALKTQVIAGSATVLYVKGKVLGLYCFAEEDGLAWSRAAVKKWSDAILVANSS